MAKATAKASAASGDKPSRVTDWRNPIRASVSVPVLSNTTVSTPAKVSMACKRRTSTPWRASKPALVSMAVGVASDKAHGQVTTSTATAAMMARAGSVGHQ